MDLVQFAYNINVKGRQAAAKEYYTRRFDLVSSYVITRRQTIKFETETASQYEKKWGFIKEAIIENAAISREANKIKLDLAKAPETRQDKNQSGLPSKLPTGLADPENRVISDWLFDNRVRNIIQYRYPSEKYSMPATTSSEIGWPWIPKIDALTNPKKANPFAYARNGVPEAATLEIYGKLN